MTALQVFFALAGIALLVIAAFVRPPRVSLALLGAACLATAYFVPLFARL